MLLQQQQQFILTGWHFRLKSRSKGKSKPCERRKTISLYLKLFLASVFICCGTRRLAIYCCWCIQWLNVSDFSHLSFSLLRKRRPPVVTCDELRAHAVHSGTHVAHGGRLFFCGFSGTEAQVHDRQPCAPPKRFFTDYSEVSVECEQHTRHFLVQKEEKGVCVCLRGLCLHTGL